MPDPSRANSDLPPIPAKRYFTIGEVSDLCAVKPHVLRYWEQEFAQLKPVKRRGNRRYYQHHEVLLIRRIRDLLYEQGFTINGARHRLESDVTAPENPASDSRWSIVRDGRSVSTNAGHRAYSGRADANALDPAEIRQELEEIRHLLGHDS
jgi:DNA-binding transcriptional MerR regulator